MIEFKRAIIIGVIVFFVVAIFIIAICSHVSDGKSLCPRGELFYKAKGECFKKGAQGPCHETMVLDEIYPKSEFGGCGCAYAENERSLLYHKETNQCYFIFSQGFCEDGFWVNMTESGTPFCGKNICLNKLSHEKDEEVVPFKKGSCAILHRKAEGCVHGVQFVHPLVYPICPNRSNKIKIHFGAIASVASHTPCPLGSYRNILGYCTPKSGTDMIFNFT